METKTETNNSVKLRILALIQTVTAIAFVGIAVIILSIFLWALTTSLVAIGILILAVIFLWFIVPMFEIYTIAILFKNCKAISIINEKEDEKCVKRIAGYLLAAGFASGLISILPNLFIGIFGSGSTLRNIWSFAIALIGIYMAYKSFLLFGNIPGHLLKRIASLFCVVTCLASITFTIYFAGYFGYLVQSYKYVKKVPTYSGSSESLTQTVIVPALDSPIEKNKNVIWSSAFNLAFNKLQNDTANELGGVFDSNDIESKSYYAAAGKISDGIIENIKKDIAAKFPKHSVPQFNKSAESFVYSCLDLYVPFKYPFPQYKERFEFTDSQGRETEVKAFGLSESLKYTDIINQVTLLFSKIDPNTFSKDRQVKEFAIDLCKYSNPYQVVISVVEPKQTLGETIEYINGKIEDFKITKDPSNESKFIGYDILLVPEMFWQINHQFKELKNVEAYQEISLRFDRSGTVLEDKSKPMKNSVTRRFECNRPFMLYIKKRNSAQPFFVMWIDNAELLNKKAVTK